MANFGLPTAEMKLSLAVMALLAIGAAGIYGFRARPAPTHSMPPGNATEKGPLLIELFTSEGCSSCPPADGLMARVLTEQPYEGLTVIPIEEHVDYWDNKAWRDPFSAKLFTDRQVGYAHRFGIDGPYTPQAVLNGNAEFLGNEPQAIDRAMSQASAPLLIGLKATRDAEKTLTVTVDTPAFEQARTAYIIVTEDGLSSDVKGGENAGRNLKHASVARSFQKLGQVAAGKPLQQTVQVTLDPRWNAAHLRVVAFAQLSQFGPIVETGSVSVN